MPICDLELPFPASIRCLNNTGLVTQVTLGLRPYCTQIRLPPAFNSIRIICIEAAEKLIKLFVEIFKMCIIAIIIHFARSLTSKFKIDKWLYEEHSSGSLPILNTKEMLASIREGGRASASNKDCSISNNGLTIVVSNFL